MNFKKFRQYLSDKYSISKAFLFLGYIKEYQKMYDNLKKDGYILKFKPILNLKDGTPKGNVDPELILSAMLEFYNFDKAVIITGDGDFYCLIELLIRKNSLEKLIVPDQHNYSSLYRNLNKQILFMNGLRGKFEYIDKQ